MTRALAALVNLPALLVRVAVLPVAARLIRPPCLCAEQGHVCGDDPYCRCCAVRN